MYFPSGRFKGIVVLADLVVFRTVTAFPWLVYTSIERLAGGTIWGFPLAKNCTDEPFLY